MRTLWWNEEGVQHIPQKKPQGKSSVGVGRRIILKWMLLKWR